MQENDQQGLSSISHSRSIEEMAEFWDSHDTADYWDQFEEVEIRVTMKPRHRVVIEEETYAGVVEESRQRGIQPETLINLWVAERLHDLRSKLQPEVGGRRASESMEKQLAEKSEVYSAE
jgi:hypothetical protein